VRGKKEGRGKKSAPLNRVKTGGKGAKKPEGSPDETGSPSGKAQPKMI
jgi:hypothetical protein